MNTIDHIVTNTIVKNSPHLKWIKRGTVLLSLHGSRAYGTNVEGSDEDFKGIAIPTKEYLFGYMKTFDQVEVHEPDAVIYNIRKFFKLASNCNPNIMEVLFCDEQDVIFANDIGREILDNRDLFISKKARFTFSGYACSQLKRIKLHRGYLLNPPKCQPLRKQFGLAERCKIPTHHLTAAQSAVHKELDRLNFKFLDSLESSERIEVRNQVTDLLTEFKIYHDEQYIAMARKIGFDDNVIEILRDERAYAQAKREWDNYQNWKKNRNAARAKDEAKFGIDLKHAYHLIRLMRMSEEIISTGKVIVKRPDYKELLDIRNGAWSYEKILEEAEQIEAALPELYNNSPVPNKPDVKQIDKLCIRLVEKQLSSQ